MTGRDSGISRNRLEFFIRLVEQENVDILLLQEIARTPKLKVDEWLADRLNMSYVYSRANGSTHIGFEEGLGVFSRFKMKRFPFVRQVSRLTNPFVRRLALGVEVDTPCGEILAFSVHLGLLRKQNAQQLLELRHMDQPSRGWQVDHHWRRFQCAREKPPDAEGESLLAGYFSRNPIRWSFPYAHSEMAVGREVFEPSDRLYFRAAGKTFLESDVC